MERCNLYNIKISPLIRSFLLPTCSSSKAIEVLEAYEGTLEDDYPPENERYEHGEMLLYKVPTVLSFSGLGLQYKYSQYRFTSNLHFHEHSEL